LTLTVHTGQTLTAGTAYTFAFDVTNPAAAQGAATPSIAASGTAAFAPAAMTQPNSALLGVTNGANPLLIAFVNCGAGESWMRHGMPSYPIYSLCVIGKRIIDENIYRQREVLLV
jgi:hypothetical protein